MTNGMQKNRHCLDRDLSDVYMAWRRHGSAEPETARGPRDAVSSSINMEQYGIGNLPRNRRTKKGRLTTVTCRPSKAPFLFTGVTFGDSFCRGFRSLARVTPLIPFCGINRSCWFNFATYIHESATSTSSQML